MEALHGRLSPQSVFLEARLVLRKYLALETSLIEAAERLPEDDFCHMARENLHLGAGCAYQALTEVGREQLTIRPVPNEVELFLSPEELEKACSYFFLTRPRNRYLDEATDLQYRQQTCDAAFSYLFDGESCDSNEIIDGYEVEGLAAFIRGFAMVYSVSAERLDRATKKTYLRSLLLGADERT